MKAFVMRTGYIQRAKKRDRVQPPRSRRFDVSKFVEVTIGKGRVFFDISDDAIIGFSLNRADLRELLDELYLKELNDREPAF